MQRILLVGEGSSWRCAQAAALLFRHLLPDVVVTIFRPVALLNLGEATDPDHDLAVEVSWSGTTDSLLKVDAWLADLNLVRLSVTGRPQSVLGRRTAGSAGTLDVYTGIEVSVASIKGYEATVMALQLLALQLATERDPGVNMAERARLTDELALIIPQQVRALIGDDGRRTRLRQLVGERCGRFNKVAVVGDGPVEVEGELKIEELAQIVTGSFDFQAASLRGLIERSALSGDERNRTLFIVNVTTPEAVQQARPFIEYLHALELFCIVHTIPNALAESWQALPLTEVFVSPAVSRTLQPLIDAPFFFDLAVGMAYARGLTPEAIDRPRNLAKSVTTTGAERRAFVEVRREFRNADMVGFTQVEPGRDLFMVGQTAASRQALVLLRGALAVVPKRPPEPLLNARVTHLVLLSDTEATENAAHMAALAWRELLGIELVIFRRFVSEPPPVPPGWALMRLVRSGAIPTLRDAETITLPADLSPLHSELVATVFLAGLAARLACERGADAGLWEAGLARMPGTVASLWEDHQLADSIQAVLRPFVRAGYDKAQIIGGGQDFAAARSIARSMRQRGFMAEALYTESAWHGPLAAVGGPDADHDALILILATDPLFQAAALVDTQVYRTRNAPVLLIVPQGNETLPAVRGVEATAVISVPAVPRPFTPLVGATFGSLFARQMGELWALGPE